MSVTWPMIVPTFARSSVNFMQPMIGVIRPIERMIMIMNFSGVSVPFFSSSPPMGNTLRSVAGIMFMAKVKKKLLLFIQSM